MLEHYCSVSFLAGFERAAKSSSLKSAKTATVVVEPLLQSSEANLQSSHRFV